MNPFAWLCLPGALPGNGILCILVLDSRLRYAYSFATTPNLEHVRPGSLARSHEFLVCLHNAQEATQEAATSANKVLFFRHPLLTSGEEAASLCYAGCARCDMCNHLRPSHSTTLVSQGIARSKGLRVTTRRDSGAFTCRIVHSLHYRASA